MITLTPLELAIMKSIWRRRAGQVRDVQADLLPDRDLAYTTVMTVMDRLFKKGALGRTRKSRAHIYEATISEEEVRADAVSGLVDSFFDGSESRLKAYLSGGEEPPPPAVSGSEAVSPQSSIDDSLL